MAGVRADQVALYTQDMYKAERESYKEVDTGYDKVFKVVTITKGSGDKSTQLLGAGALTRHTVEGQKIVFKSPVQGWSFYTYYDTYSDGLSLSKNAVEDSVKLGNLLKELASTWGVSHRIAKEEHAAHVFNDGGDLSGYWVFNGSDLAAGNTAPYGNMYYDDKPLFNLTGNKNTTKGGGTYYSAVVSLTINKTDFATLYNLLTVTNAKDERDREIKLEVDTLLTESGSYRFLAEQLLNSTLLPGTELNDVNPYYKIVTPMDWRYLSDSGAFYVGKRQHKDFQFCERQMPEIRFFRDETDLGYSASFNARFSVFLKTRKAWVKGGGSYN